MSRGVAIQNLRKNQSTATFAKATSAAIRSVPAQLFFHRRGLALREAWVAMRFGEMAGASHLRLAPNKCAGFDFIATLQGHEHRIEITEALDPVRDRVVEYSRLGGTESVSGAEMAYEENLVQPRLTASFRKKAKNANVENLLVYLNTGFLDWHSLPSVLESLRERYRCRFSASYVLTGETMFQVTPSIRQLAQRR